MTLQKNVKEEVNKESKIKSWTERDTKKTRNCVKIFSWQALYATLGRTLNNEGKKIKVRLLQ